MSEPGADGQAVPQSESLSQPTPLDVPAFPPTEQQLFVLCRRYRTSKEPQVFDQLKLVMAQLEGRDEAPSVLVKMEYADMLYMNFKHTDELSTLHLSTTYQWQVLRTASTDDRRVRMRMIYNLIHGLSKLTVRTKQTVFRRQLIECVEERRRIPFYSATDRLEGTLILLETLRQLAYRTGDVTLFHRAASIGAPLAKAVPREHPHRAYVCVTVGNILMDIASTEGLNRGMYRSDNPAIPLYSEALEASVPGDPRMIRPAVVVSIGLLREAVESGDTAMLHKGITILKSTYTGWLLGPLNGAVVTFLDATVTIAATAIGPFTRIGVVSTVGDALAAIQSTVKLMVSSALWKGPAALLLQTKALVFEAGTSDRMYVPTAGAHVALVSGCSSPASVLEMLSEVHDVFWQAAESRRDLAARPGGGPSFADLDADTIESSMLPDYDERSCDGVSPQSFPSPAEHAEQAPTPSRSWNELRHAAAHGPVVVLLSMNGRCDAILIPDPVAPPRHLHLEQAAGQDLHAWSQIWTNSTSGGRGWTYLRGLAIARRERTKSWQVLQQLWLKVVKPILLALGLQPSTGSSRPQIHWFPTGAFVPLPLHAAGLRQGESCSDYVVSSYTSSLVALLQARKGAEDVCTGRSSALLVGVEDAPGMPRLHTIRQEPDAVSEALAQGSIAAERREGADATVAAVARDLSRASMVHLACHGVQDTQRPLDSGFCLADGRLTIARLMDLHMPRAFLAFLSACETAKGDPLQMDEAIHLSSALLFAGFNSVIATMWSMHDQDGPVIAKRVYDYLCSQEQIKADDVAYALDHAIQEMRSQGLPPERWAPFIHLGA